MRMTGIAKARIAARARILAGYGDRDAAARYRALAESGNVSPAIAQEYRERALECEKLAAGKLRSSM